MTARCLLVLGGARSGKSREAERLAAEAGLPVTCIATATAGDAEMARRIARHRAERPASWRTLEVPLDLPAALATLTPGEVALVDCLTLWLANLMAAGRDVERETAHLAAALERSAGPVVLVSNETGLGIVPATPLGRDFRDAQGRLNQAMAGVCDGVQVMVAGLPIVLKPAPQGARLRLRLED